MLWFGSFGGFGRSNRFLSLCPLARNQNLNLNLNLNVNVNVKRNGSGRVVEKVSKVGVEVEVDQKQSGQ